MSDKLPEAIPPFRVAPIYDHHSDSLMVYLRDEPSHGVPAGDAVTVFWSDDKQRVIGIEVTGVRRLALTPPGGPASSRTKSVTPHSADSRPAVWYTDHDLGFIEEMPYG